jgi:hypothetical protein
MKSFCWLGHRLHADVAIAVDETLPLSEATRLADQLRGELMAHMPALRTATITFATPDDANVLEVLPYAHGHDHSHGNHHAPAPFVVNGDLAKGKLAIVDTPAGGRFRLTVTNHEDGLEAVVVISRPNGNEALSLKPLPTDHHIFESQVAPAEPHEFTAALHLMAPGRHLSTGRAIELLEDYGVETSQGPIKAPEGLLRRSTVNRYLTTLRLDQTHLLRQPPATRFQAEHSNDCWQFDMSPSDLRLGQGRADTNAVQRGR